MDKFTIYAFATAEDIITAASKEEAIAMFLDMNANGSVRWRCDDDDVKVASSAEMAEANTIAATYRASIPTE